MTKCAGGSVPAAARVAALPLDEIETAVQRCNFYKTKAKNVLSAARHALARGGRPPSTYDGLLALDGVGPKIAHLLRSVAYGHEDAGIVVDTHVFRVAQRLRWVDAAIATAGAEAVRAALEHWVPTEERVAFSLAVVGFGQHTRSGEGWGTIFIDEVQRSVAACEEAFDGDAKGTQRRIVSRSSMYPAPSPGGSSTAATPMMGRLSMNTPDMATKSGMATGLMAPPPRPAAVASVTPLAELTTPSVMTPVTPAELEAQSIQLAYKLQQEEHAAFLQAVRMSSPGSRSASAATAFESPRPQATSDSAAASAGMLHHQMMELDPGDPDEESLKLALQLQHEELQWQALQSRRAMAEAMGGDVDDDSDEDVRLARLLQAQEDDEAGY